MTFQTKRCPHCRKVYESNSYAGYPSKANRIKYGCPIKVCNSCQKVFVDKEYREIAVEGIQEVDKARVSPATIVYSLFGCFLGIGVFVSVNQIAGLVILGLSAWLFFDEWNGYEGRQERLVTLRKESEERLNNPVYAALLKKMGYDVPEKYLSQKSSTETDMPIGQ